MKKRQLIIVGTSVLIIVGSLLLNNLFSGMKEEPKKHSTPSM